MASEYERLDSPLTPSQIAAYDRVAKAWQVIFQNVQAALGLTDGADSRQKQDAENIFWASEQRFFNQLITAMKTPKMLEHIDTYFSDPDGGAAVIQLTNTNQATQDRRLAQMQEDDRLEDLTVSPMDILMEYVQNAFPVIQQVEVADAEGDGTHWEPLMEEGKPVLNPEAVELRDRLLDDLSILEQDIDEGPLEQILDHFGPEAVAEITGRQQRLVFRENAEGKPERVP